MRAVPRPDFPIGLLLILYFFLLFFHFPPSVHFSVETHTISTDLATCCSWQPTMAGKPQLPFSSLSKLDQAGREESSLRGEKGEEPQGEKTARGDDWNGRGACRGGGASQGRKACQGRGSCCSAFKIRPCLSPGSLCSGRRGLPRAGEARGAPHAGPTLGRLRLRGVDEHGRKHQGPSHHHGHCLGDGTVPAANHPREGETGHRSPIQHCFLCPLQSSSSGSG